MVQQVNFGLQDVVCQLLPPVAMCPTKKNFGKFIGKNRKSEGCLFLIIFFKSVVEKFKSLKFNLLPII